MQMSLNVTRKAGDTLSWNGALNECERGFIWCHWCSVSQLPGRIVGKFNWRSGRRRRMENVKHSQDSRDVRQGSQQVCSRRFGRAYPVKGATFPPFVWGVTINMTQRSASTERLCYQYVSDWQMAFRDRILIFVQALVSTLLHSVSPNRARILKPSSSTLQQPCRSP